MTSDEALVAVIDALDHLGLPYMLTGSLASNFHGIPRSTRDADLVVDLPADGVGRLAAALPPELVLDRQASFETVTGTTRHVARLRGSVFLVELFQLSDDPHDISRLARRLRVQALGRHVWVAAVDDVVVTKLRWAAGGHRVKDLEDVRNVVAVSGDAIDWGYVRQWCGRHGTEALLDQVLAERG